MATVNPIRANSRCHRRVFLVLPNLDLSHPTIQALSPLQFYSAFDISVRTTQSAPDTWGRLANSLEDLTRRENRIAHDVSGAWPTLVTPEPAVPVVCSGADCWFLKAPWRLRARTVRGVSMVWTTTAMA